MSAYDWYNAALADNVAWYDEYLPPQAGYYKIRAVPWATYIKPQYKEFEPIKIIWDGERDESGKLVDDERMFAYIRDYLIHENHLDDIWLACQQTPISHSEYLKLLGN